MEGAPSLGRVESFFSSLPLKVSLPSKRLPLWPCTSGAAGPAQEMKHSLSRLSSSRSGCTRASSSLVPQGQGMAPATSQSGGDIAHCLAPVGLSTQLGPFPIHHPGQAARAVQAKRRGPPVNTGTGGMRELSHMPRVWDRGDIPGQYTLKWQDGQKE